MNQKIPTDGNDNDQRNKAKFTSSHFPKLQQSLCLNPIQADIIPKQIFDVSSSSYDFDKQFEFENQLDLNIPNNYIPQSQIENEQKILDTLQIAFESSRLKDQQRATEKGFLINDIEGRSPLRLEILGEKKDSQKIESKFFSTSYYSGYGWIAQMCFIHLTKYMWLVKLAIIDKGLKLTVDHLPTLAEGEKIENLFQIALQRYERIKTNQVITKKDMIQLIFFGQLRGRFLLILFYNLTESLSKGCVSILLGYLLKNIFIKNFKFAYIYATIIALVNMLGLIGRNNAQYEAAQFQIKIRMILINLVYQKMTDLNSYSIKAANLGKIINTISTDLNLLELYLPYVFQSIVLPVSLAFGSGILWVRFNGPIGLLGVLFMVILYPLQVLYQRMNLAYTKKLRFYGDNRLKLQNEMIEGIRLIKMFAWEQAFVLLLKATRKMEFACIIDIALINAYDRVSNQIIHIWASLLLFIVIYYGGYAKLTSINMIPTIYLMVQLKQSCIIFVSIALQGFMNLKICIQRIVDLLNLENLVMTKLEPVSRKNMQQETLTSNKTPVLSFKNYSCGWTRDACELMMPVLKNINIDIYAGQIVAVIGRIGSGKSTLLSSVIMEVPFFEGQYYINGEQASDQNYVSFGYVEQDPVIFPDTLRKNILFGRPYDEKLYKLVISVSNLVDDLRQFQNEDYTYIGEKGITLSRGQRARVSLARALYQKADIYVFDSILSALDTQVARNILDYAIKDFIFKVQPGLTRSSTKPVILVATDNIQFAKECDSILVLEQGSIVAQGQYEDIKESLKLVSKELLLIDDTNFGKNILQSPLYPSLLKSHSQSGSNIARQSIQLYKREDASQQIVTLKTFVRYFKLWSPPYLIIIIMIQCLGQEIIYNLYLRYVSLFDQTDKKEINSLFILFGGLLVLSFVNNLTKYIQNTNGVLATNRYLHNNMLDKLSICPIEFFDTNPSGRILNRFSTDLQFATTQMNNLLLDVMELTSFFIVALIVIIILQPWLIFIIIFTIVMNMFFFRFCQPIIVQARECDLIQRSPLFDQFRKTFSAIIHIRLYKQQRQFHKEFFDLSNKCIQSNLAYHYTQRSFGMNIDIIGWIASTVCIFIIITFDSSDHAGFVQVLLLLLTFDDTQQWCLRQITQSYSIMNCFNRMFQILDLESEAPHQMSIDGDLKNSWPSLGKIQFNNVSMRYRIDTSLVLQNLTFTINPGEKVGCVGRTGAGKSSILQVLFRLVEIETRIGSSILIDNQDISKLGLNFLRSSMGVIPQIPFVFSGTIKRNLDPFEKFTDDEIWQALDETQLSLKVKKMTRQLDTDMTDVQSIFSMGENQLLCLARLILNPKKIIILDEATSNLDMNTDEYIQNQIREKFADCTVLTIAHRLNTIANYDRVMVLEQGQVIEFGTPLELLSTNLQNPTIDRETSFATLVKKTGQKNALFILGLANKQYHKINKSK